MTDSVEQAAQGGDALVDLEERRWLARHVEGDERAFAELLAAYRAPVYGFLVRAGVDVGTRDDLFQEVFLKIHGAAHSYQPSRPLKPWLFTIVANTVRSHFRKQTVHQRAFHPGEAPPSPDPAAGPDRLALARDTLAWLEHAIPRLPLAHREVLLLTCVEEMDHKQVASALQIPVNTVKTNLRRARHALARWLTEREQGQPQEAS